MKSETGKIIYIYLVCAAFISFAFFTAIGVFTAMSETKYISTGESSPVIVFENTTNRNG